MAPLDRVILIGILIFLLGQCVSVLLGAEIEWFPDAFSIQVTGLQVCDGASLDSYPTQQITQTDFQEDRIFLCGHLINHSLPQPARPHFYIMPDNGGAIWDKRETFRFEEGDFFVPVEGVVPEFGHYTINLYRGKEILYSAEFSVVP